MPRPKKSQAKDKPKSATTALADDREERTLADSITTNSPRSKMMMRGLGILAAIFFVIWIAVGLFFLLVISQGVRRGAYEGLLGAGPAATDTTMPEAQAQTEVTLPGIGTVNIACVQSAVSPESIQKLITEKKIDVLQGEERTNFEKCIVAPESPAASPSGQ